AFLRSATKSKLQPTVDGHKERCAQVGKTGLEREVLRRATGVHCKGECTGNVEDFKLFHKS
ncbi:MAG: hypothetical protein QXX87_02390, partial [Candidatus Jordarchaeales archaeon]